MREFEDPRYRFKTEEELTEEYGKNWREEMGYFWIYHMNEYLGKEIKPSLNTAMDQNKSIFYAGWSFCNKSYISLRAPQKVKGLIVKKNGLLTC